MHVAVADQFAESPQPGGSIGSLRGNVLVAWHRQWSTRFGHIEYADEYE
jgi:hypothetical protein